MTQEKIILTVEISPIRFWAGFIVTAALGILLLGVLVFSPPSQPLSYVILTGAGLFALWQAHRMTQTAKRAIHMTETHLHDDTGTVLATFDEIDRIERGLFAFKPSNGFVLVLRQKRPRHWVPGLWWQRGKRLGIGGMANAQQTKIMADILQTMLAKRDNLF